MLSPISFSLLKTAFFIAIPVVEYILTKPTKSSLIIKDGVSTYLIHTVICSTVLISVISSTRIEKKIHLSTLSTIFSLITSPTKAIISFWILGLIILQFFNKVLKCFKSAVSPQ